MWASVNEAAASVSLNVMQPNMRMCSSGRPPVILNLRMMGINGINGNNGAMRT
jgi:hypothetical protein